MVQGRQDWNAPTGRGATECSSTGAVQLSVLFCVTFHLLCILTKYTVVDTALGPTSTLGMLAVVPGVSQKLFPQGHQCRSTEVRSQDCSSRAPGPAVGAMEAAQTLARPSPQVYVPTEPAAAKT